MQLHPQDAAVAAPPLPGSGAEARVRQASPLRRRLLWAGGLLLLLALLVLTPPLVNANRYRGKIAESMSKSLGRPVHLDNVSLHLLPTPGFTLQNLVVSEDPEFGAEPTIRANTVEATLRVSSLWHHPVEFSTVRFVEPSVNLVRNPDGRWNLADVLLHASRVQSAPTVQRHAGPTPRFPYIEATGGRVNVKLGAEKLPFSLTDADFALWLPSPQQWRVRLIGQPARTDSNINDPGRLQMEGELRRAATAAEVPVNFHASWHDAPLGEATRILSGGDWGWRGSINLDADLRGLLGNAQLTTKLTLGGLRRAEFFPARPLDLQVTCASGFALHPATLTGLNCTLPDNAPQPLVLHADAIRPQTVAQAPITITGQQIPARWMMLWAALFSPRVPATSQPTGTVDVAIARRVPLAAALPPSRAGRHKSAAPMPVRVPAGISWTGTIRMSLPSSLPSATADDAAPNDLVWNVVAPATTSLWPALHLAPTPVTLGPGAVVTVEGGLGEDGYRLAVNGSAPAAALLQPARYLPELGDGLQDVLPFPPTSLNPGKVQFTCTRSWSTAQVCTGLQPANNARTPPATADGSSAAPQQPALLAPKSLSPLDQTAPGALQQPLSSTTPQ